MVDIVDKKTRSLMMKGIRSKNTNPELIIRKMLHSHGFRFRLHPNHLPGKPDLILPKYHIAIFINGCFWHGHSCNLFKWPKTNAEFWKNKITKNKTRDLKNVRNLVSQEWRVLRIWECSLKGTTNIGYERIFEKFYAWLESESVTKQIRGKR